MPSASARAAPEHSASELLGALRRYWGYDSFRPMQERIVRSLLAGQDACVVMPTGGGKSLCYQLPAALLADRTVVVVSPLIALMQDQVAQLGQMGISAALLNSTIAAREQAEIVREAIAGRYRLLYLSPERLARADTIEWLQRVPVSLFAIDEAHCISEWGHEFRPEYRQLSSLRKHFPDRPIAAFTASATRQVRHDIIEQLALRDPHKYIASFHRANLRYMVKQCDASTQSHLLLRALRSYEGSNVIVYSPTVAGVEETVAFLAEKGIRAIGYHGKMDSATRRRHQEKWMSDEVPVLVGTVAFGLGINKAAVRAVIHLSLPKSIEQYYQEAGRAGRDGLPADCVMLWQKKDIGLLMYFIEQLGDSKEHERALQRYYTIRNFVDSSRCRHQQICLHFGENPKWTKCGVCDACGYKIDWLSAPVSVRKPKRRKKRPGAGASVGPPITFTRGPRPGQENDLAINTPAGAGAPGSGWWGSSGKRDISGPLEVDPELREYMREWRLSMCRKLKISAFRIMYDKSLNSLCQTHPRSLSELRKVSGFDERKSAEWGPAILAALEEFRNGARAVVDAPVAAVEPDVDPDLREYMRAWRRMTARKLKTLAFIIMHDTSLDHLCQVHPRSLIQLREVSGFGERKTEMYGPDILKALERFRNGERTVPEASDD